MNKFKCDNKECKVYNDTEFRYPVVKHSYTESGVIYKLLNGNEIVCPACGKPLIEIKEFKGYATWKGGFDSKSPDEKKEILIKREREHTKKDKQFQEYKAHMDNENN
jgi:hypothetical protein